MVIKNDLSPNKPHHFHSDYRAHHHLAGNPEKGFFLMFNFLQDSWLHNEVKNIQKLFSAFSINISKQYLELEERISALETAAITATKSPKRKRRGKVVGNARSK